MPILYSLRSIYIRLIEARKHADLTTIGITIRQEIKITTLTNTNQAKT
jgi:hypothetical protein